MARVALAAAALAALALAAAVVAVGCNDDVPLLSDPSDGTVQPGDLIVDLTLRPATLVLDTTTSFQLLCVGLTDDGYTATLDDCAFEVLDGTALELTADGLVEPVTAGETTVAATRGQLTSPATPVTIVEPGTLDVRVTDFAGEPRIGARVQVVTPDVIAEGTADADGIVHLEGTFSGPVDLAIRSYGHLDTLLQGVRARNVVVALRDERTEIPRASAKGTVTFPEEPAVGEMAIAVALTSTPVGPAFTSVADFMPGNRTISDFGLNVDLPYNLVVHNIVEDFSAPVYEGTAVLSVAGGYFDLGEVLGIAAAVAEHGPGAVFNIIGIYADRLMLGLHGPFEVPVETADDPSIVEGLELALEYPLDREVAVTLLTPPPDFYTEDPPTILAYRQLEQELGWVIAGVGVGTEPYSHPDADPPDDEDDSAGDDDDGTWSAIAWKEGDEPWETIPLIEAAASHELGSPYTVYGAMANYHGLSKSGDATLSFSPPMTGSNVVLPPFLPLYEDLVTDTPLGHFDYDGDPAADLARSYLYYWEEDIVDPDDPADWRRIEVLGDGGPGEIDVPESFLDFTPPDLNYTLENAWILDAVGLRGADFQTLVVDDGLDGLERFQHLSYRRSVISRRWDSP